MQYQNRSRINGSAVSVPVPYHCRRRICDSPVSFPTPYHCQSRISAISYHYRFRSLPVLYQCWLVSMPVPYQRRFVSLPAPFQGRRRIIASPVSVCGQYQFPPRAVSRPAGRNFTPVTAAWRRCEEFGGDYYISLGRRLQTLHLRGDY